MKKLIGICFKIGIVVFALAIILGKIAMPQQFTTITNVCKGMYYVYKGDKAYQKKNLQNAVDYYNKGLELYPNHYGAWFNLGNIYVVYEDYYAAIDSYQKAFNLKPSFTLARMNYGIISTEKLGNFDEAIAQYNIIVNSKNKLWTIPFIYNNKKTEKINKGLAYYNLGLAYRERSIYEENFNPEEAKSDLTKAIEAYQNAIKILKDNYSIQYNLALAYHLKGQYQKSGAHYCEAISIEPMNYEAHYNLAILLKHLKLYKEAYNEVEKASILISQGTNSNTQSYVFDILNDISQTLVIQDKYNYLVEKIDNTTPNNDDITYVNGKIVSTEALDKAMLENFRTCESKKFFEGKQ